MHAARAESRPDKLQVGSIKGNLGHLNTVAGVASFVKAALAVSHGAAPPSIHSAPLSAHVPWASLPLEVAPSHPRPSPNPDPISFL